jgi:hypothetical protein
LLKFWRDALTTPLKITGTQACARNFRTLRRSSRFRPESTSQSLALRSLKDVA